MVNYSIRWIAANSLENASRCWLIQLLDLHASKCRSYVENKYSWDNAAKIVYDNLESDKLLVMPKNAY